MNTFPQPVETTTIETIRTAERKRFTGHPHSCENGITFGRIGCQSPIAVFGYTDDIGTQTYNLQLSRRRAEAVRDFLVQTGISPTIMSTKGFGKSDPRISGNSEQARAANRRVEIAIVDSKVLTNGLLVVPK
jgi:hypothetical protein